MYQDHLNAGSVPFDGLPSEMTVRAFGVDYGRVHTAEAGDLYVTRFGWPFRRHLLPENWYDNQWYGLSGERLPGSTGHVYRVPTKPVDGRSIDIVVKFSRVGQEVPLEVATSFPGDVSAEDVALGRFNSPVEEFGLVMEMRRGSYGPASIRILSHRPLAIYAPPEQVELWQSGRSHGRFHLHRQLLGETRQEGRLAIELDIKRPYVLIYSWLKGGNAEEAFLAGAISEHELHGLTRRVTDELRAKGFWVLDNKPKHFILRTDGADGQVMRRDGRLVYGLVDFELLERTADYKRRFRIAQRARYWQMQSHRLGRPTVELPPPLKRTTLFGVNYIFHTSPSGGRIWTVGTDPDLADYFLPERWRRTPRVKLSPGNEVYRTRTRDAIHVVYRRSRVGERPQLDPFYERYRRIREHGYNSPFEEVAIAERLRQAGIHTTYPRAIYRTDHQSTRAGSIRDERRYTSHADLLTPEADAEPVLTPDRDYYVVSGCYRGIDPEKHYREYGHWGFVDLEKAHEDGLLSDDQHHHVSVITRGRLAATGLLDAAFDDSDFLLTFDEAGTLRRDPRGELEVTWCMSALAAHEHSLMDEEAYCDLIERMRERLRAAGCEALDLSGRHLLLSLNPDGRIARDRDGKFEVCLCNFALIHPTFGPVESP